MENKLKYMCCGDTSDELTGDKDKLARELLGSQHADEYIPPDRTYDESFEVTPEYIQTLPDLQNGPSSLIQGAEVFLHQVGIHNFRMPLKFRTKEGGHKIIDASITGTVSLDAHKKGINMSRIIRTFYVFEKEEFDLDKVGDILQAYRDNLKTFDTKVYIKFSYPVMQKSLRSGLSGYQYYDVVFECDLNVEGYFNKIIHFDFVYSSACPCSFELGQHARKYRNKAVVSHSQRSTSRISVRLNDGYFLWIEDLIELCQNALKTETQVIVKREDEQAFAELNGTYLKFVEDAARLLYQSLEAVPAISDFRIICGHWESLHSHNAISVVKSGQYFSPDVPEEVYRSMIR